MTVAKEPGERGEHEGNRSNHCVRECRVIPVYSLLLVCVLPLSLHTRPRVHWASGIPHALFGREIQQRLGRMARRGRERVSGVEMPTLVMPGLDPGIHPSSQDHFRRRWIAGSSPAMTE